MLKDENTSKEKANNNASQSQNMSDDIQSIKKDSAHMAETVARQGQEKYDQIKSYSAHYIEALEEKVAEKPVQSMAIAVGTGMLLSFLMKRR